MCVWVVCEWCVVTSLVTVDFDWLCVCAAASASCLGNSTRYQVRITTYSTLSTSTLNFVRHFLIKVVKHDKK